MEFITEKLCEVIKRTATILMKICNRFYKKIVDLTKRIIHEYIRYLLKG